MNLSEFLQIISEARKPVVVDFWAAWCAPCKMTKPILEKLAKEFGHGVEFVPVDADASSEVLKQLRVFSIPAVLTFRNGKEVGRVTGAQNEGNYRTLFEALARGKEVKIPLARLDRILRLSAGALIVIIGFSTSNWLVAGAGGMLAFMGVYDRCPVWAAIAGMLQRK